ncbi:hypothetical protein ACTVD8_006004 [Pseudomonas aeruginosa]
MSERYRVEQTGKGFWPYCVRAGNGTRDLYVGHKKTCDRVAAELTTAFRDGEFVGKGLYDALAAEAQALREQNTKFQHMLADITVKHFSDNIKRSTAQKSMDVYLSDGIRLLEEERDRIERNRDMWKGQCERQAEQLAALRARVAVVPDRLPRSSDIAAIRQHSIGWNACLDELARLNGMTVSESALDTLRRFATGKVMHLNNGLCPDDIDGHEARDPDCPVCRALIETGKESDNV